MAELSARRVTNLYDPMDPAYDAGPLREYSRSLGHVPLIDANPRLDTARKAELPTEEKRRQPPGCEAAEDVLFTSAPRWRE